MDYRKGEYKISYLQGLGKSFEYLQRDSRKLVSFVLVLSLPLVENIWRVIPKNISFPYYGDASVFAWTFSVNFVVVLIALGWFLTIPRRDFALQLIAFAAVFYGLFMTFNTLPVAGTTSGWQDILATFLIGIFIFVSIFYIRNFYLNRPTDYKVLHDALVHDLHHEKFLGDISRLEGLIDVAEMEEPYNTMCKEEIGKIKESIAYITDKYRELK